MGELVQKITSASAPANDIHIIAHEAVIRIAREENLSVKEVELAALRAHLLPGRYHRSLGTVGWDGQIRLLESTVIIIGAGGLGGWIIEGLARMGVGHLIIVDGDVFEENNLNRQALCWEETIGRPKAEAAKDRVAKINSAVEVTALQMWATEENLPGILEDADVVVDALDTLPIRIVLQTVCSNSGIPMVHGAIGGYIGQVTTILPGDPGLKALYGEGPLPERGVEVEWGNPAGTPMMVSAWQIQEVIKILLGKGELLRRRLLFLDAESGTVDSFHLE
jgi:molybdopterin-synthase adenylyltransferase